MLNKNTDKNLEKIRVQIELLKKRIHNMDRTLTVQEKAIDLIDEKSKTLLKDAQLGSKDISIEEIMKNAFSGKTMPSILFKE